MHNRNTIDGMPPELISQEIVNRIQACEQVIEQVTRDGQDAQPHMLQLEFLEQIAESLSSFGNLSAQTVLVELHDFQKTHQLASSLVEGNPEEVAEQPNDSRYVRMNDFFVRDRDSGHVVVRANELSREDSHPPIIATIDACLQRIADAPMQQEQSQTSIPPELASPDELRKDIQAEAQPAAVEEQLIERQEQAFEQGRPVNREPSEATNGQPIAHSEDNASNTYLLRAITIGVLAAVFLLGFFVFYTIYW